MVRTSRQSLEGEPFSALNMRSPLGDCLRILRLACEKGGRTLFSGIELAS
jgi:hypothetical protein